MFSFKSKLVSLAFIAMVPLLIISIYLLVSLRSYSQAYDSIVSNMTVANSYSMNFKESMDESTYKHVASSEAFDVLGANDTNPYDFIHDLRRNFTKLERITTDSQSRAWLQTLLRNLDTLEERASDINANIIAGGKYDENIAMLDSDIYILTELIQEDIQYYIYYQTESIEGLKGQLNKQVTTFVRVVSIVLLVSIIALIITVITISGRIESSISALCKTTEEIAKGDFSARATINTRDELTILAENVNDMSEHLEIMVEQIKDDERKMRNTELRLLQEQINPHFLYNTLDTIVWLVEGNANDEAVNMVMSLSTFFRLVLSHGQEVISIKDEEKHVRSYLEIQQVRYRDILDFEIDIDEQIHQYRILKMTLQPIVENALYHGIKYKRAKGTISITGNLEDNKIKLVVKDDGVGIDVAELEKLNEEIRKPCKDTEKGFGLANVNERIKMNFGSEYGMTIKSELSVGTEVTIIIPAEQV